MDESLELIVEYSANERTTKESVYILAEKKSINQKEFYAGYNTGLNTTIAFKVFKDDFDLTKRTSNDDRTVYATEAIYDGNTYRIIRKFAADDNDLMEIYLGEI